MVATQKSGLSTVGHVSPTSGTCFFPGQRLSRLPAKAADTGFAIQKSEHDSSSVPFWVTRKIPATSDTLDEEFTLNFFRDSGLFRAGSRQTGSWRGRSVMLIQRFIQMVEHEIGGTVRRWTAVAHPDRDAALFVDNGQ